jgi:hypothetical protein
MLFLAGLLLVELHFTAAGTEVRASEEFTISGSTPVAVYGDGLRGHCFVNDAYRAVPQGVLKLGGVGRSRMLRLPADGVPKRVVCSDHVLVVESRLVPLYRLIDTDRAVVLAALGLMIGTYLGWPLRSRRPLEGRPLEVSRG